MFAKFLMLDQNVWLNVEVKGQFYLKYCLSGLLLHQRLGDLKKGLTQMLTLLRQTVALKIYIHAINDQT